MEKGKKAKTLPKITIAPSIMKGRNKKWLNNALFMVESIVEKWHEFKRHIHLPKNVDIHICTMKGNYGTACTFVENRKRQFYVEIDTKLDLDLFQATLLHELVHIEQFHERRLEDPSIDKFFRWEGELMTYHTKTLEAYNNLPWELEANIRAADLKWKIFA